MVTANEAIAAIEVGKFVEVTQDEYLDGGVRSALQAQAGKWINQEQIVYAQIALMEVQRLDRLYPPL